jgi:multisubunit Na+/H+ antiporter MnhG subunit
MSQHQAPLTAATLRRLHAMLWLACVGTYVAMMASHLAAGGSDLWAMVKASSATLAVAVLGRATLSLLGHASHDPNASTNASGTAVGGAHLGSLVDIVSSPDADPGANPNELGRSVSISPPSAAGTGNRRMRG